MTGGCTGGHIYPALAIGDKFREMDPDCEIIYVAHAYGLETEIVPKHGYELKIVTAKWVDRSNVFKLADTLWCTEIGKMQALRIMKKFKPDIVVSTGSFVSVPVVLAAKTYGAEVYIHEQNAFPGLSNKYLSKYAKKVFLGFKNASRYFKDPDKLVYSGNPVRSEFYGKDRGEARKKLGIPEDEFVITAFGGSLGADKLNDMVHEIIRQFGGRNKITILFGTGKDYYDDVMKKLDADHISGLEGVKITPYIHDMADVLAATNLVISRAGALTVAEITMSGRAAIFVPSPNVTGDHQYYNAKAVADNKGAIIVREDEEAAERILHTIDALIADPDVIEEMEKGSLESASRDATDIIYNSIMETTERK